MPVRHTWSRPCTQSVTTCRIGYLTFKCWADKHDGGPSLLHCLLSICTAPPTNSSPTWEVDPSTGSIPPLGTLVRWPPAGVGQGRCWQDNGAGRGQITDSPSPPELCGFSQSCFHQPQLTAPAGDPSPGSGFLGFPQFYSLLACKSSPLL